ncbi:MAG: aldehyde dehydrogenase [Bacteroidetes bacterium RIFOXYA12_FULL_35_11]|nr:MAG: aldehyde dehydrogenase [Bacteroidetes bacterium GWF2_35_48]OFY79867.1 MAG: aldehyde dehydrogenase [Bacteroidetes bacterium RIFOXYA12_FULL_35_11]OFY93861.1 MAG: aldehyde dehydrogenase [Bacteroidetes bacterium RIFOXYC12_FULL_35_7]OFY95782.1 MAG: aldehyde dehydrogenase [Bacteroidetes bacterium RIFOXYB2_FULL_35_7]
MDTYEIYVGGIFKKTGTVLNVVCPYDYKIFAQTFLAGKAELEEAIEKGLAAEKAMKEMPLYKRYEILMQIANELKANRQHLGKVLAMESAKPLKYALGEIDRGVQSFLVAAEESKRLPKEYMAIDWMAVGEGKEGLVKYFPMGLIAGISPFNFPLNLAAHKIAPAIAAGNPIILKPARTTPLSVLELAKIVDKTELPKGALSILPMDREAGNHLVTDPRIKMLTFTGSSSVGWKMKAEAGKKKVSLELGGNAGVIISDSANIDLAVRKCAVGAFAYSGQVCIHVQRIYIHEKIFDVFTEKFVEAVRNLKVGHPTESDTDISAMINEENALRVELWIKEAVAGGAKIICGGKRSGAFVEPTVFTSTKHEMNVCCQEVFGPVVTLEKFDNFHTAVEWVNNTEYGLQAGVFTDSIHEMNYAFNNLDVGGVMINEVSLFRVDHMPYGGVKNSGVGREGIKYAIFEMMESKLLVKNVD